MTIKQYGQAIAAGNQAQTNQPNTFTAGPQVVQAGTGQVAAITQGNSAQDAQQWKTANGAVAALVDRAGGPRTRRTTPVSGADLANSELATWLDLTPGAVRAMFRAKDGGGTVYSGSVPLTAFTPSQITGLKVQLEARSLGLADGAKVVTYTDMSGNSASPTQATAANQPIFQATGGPMGTPTVYFDGASKWMACQYAAALPQPNTIYMACGAPGTGTQSLLDGFSSGGRHQVYLDAIDVKLYAGGGGYVTGFPGQKLPLLNSLYRFVFNGANSRAYRFGFDGGAVSASPGAQGMDGVTIGMYYAGGGLPLLGHIAVLLVYAGTHTAAQSAQVEDYIANICFAESKPQVVCQGDSITYGYANPGQVTQPYPLQLAGILSGWDTYNLGINGLRADQLATQFTATTAPYWRPFRSRNILALQAGTNDLFQAGTTADVLTRLATWYSNAAALGFRVVLHTLTPSTAAGTPAGFEANRLSINASLRAASPGTYFDALADVGADPVIGNVANCGNTTYFIDGLHLTNVGYSVWALYTKAAALAA
jgi:lysophospholipase L1-like esterase